MVKIPEQARCRGLTNARRRVDPVFNSNLRSHPAQLVIPQCCTPAFPMLHKITLVLAGSWFAVAGILHADEVPQFSSEKASSFTNSPRPSGISFQSGSPGLLPETIEHHRNTTTSLLRDLLNVNLASFVFFGTDKFKTLEQEKFNVLTRQWGPSLSGGYGLNYLGEMKRNTFTTTIWRVRFFKGGNDALVVLSTNKRGTIEEFSIH